jgi:glycine dehydrogenase subunit 1
LLGEKGLAELAELNHAKACGVAERIAKIPGCHVLNETFFNEFTVQLPKAATGIVDNLAKKSILAGVPLSRFYLDKPDLQNLLLVAVTELTTDEDVTALIQALQEACQ